MSPADIRRWSRVVQDAIWLVSAPGLVVLAILNWVNAIKFDGRFAIDVINFVFAAVLTVAAAWVVAGGLRHRTERRRARGGAGESQGD